MRSEHGIDPGVLQESKELVGELGVAIADQEAVSKEEPVNDVRQFRATWAMNESLGLGVDPAMWTLRVRKSIRNSV